MLPPGAAPAETSTVIPVALLPEAGISTKELFAGVTITQLGRAAGLGVVIVSVI
jgi:hypothetical protein